MAKYQTDPDRRDPVAKAQVLRSAAPSPGADQKDRFVFPPKNAPRVAKVVIGSLDDPKLGVEAQYNPRELTVEKSIPWTPHKVKGGQEQLEFTGGTGRSLTLELLFDGFETGASVQPAVDALLEMAAVRDEVGTKGELLRPHKIAVAWGPGSDTKLPTIRGVIESITTKYSMFLPDLTPVRATCTLKIKEGALLKGSGSK